MTIDNTGGTADTGVREQVVLQGPLILAPSTSIYDRIFGVTRSAKPAERHNSNPGTWGIHRLQKRLR